MIDLDNEYINSEIKYRCKHCDLLIYRDRNGYWRHKGWVSHCRTKAVGPEEECWCGSEHKVDMRRLSKEFVSGGLDPNVVKCCFDCRYLDKGRDRDGGWCIVRRMASVSSTGGCSNYCQSK
jgi:hypothetical protein